MQWKGLQRNGQALLLFTVFLKILSVEVEGSLLSLAGSLSPLTLVIFLSPHLQIVSPLSVRNGQRGQAEESSSGSESGSLEDEEEAIKLVPRFIRRRVSRQLGLLAPALQTMGCLPKFFCGMRSKQPSGATSTLNDLAYLIKFAMVDDLEDSGEDKGKDDLKKVSQTDKEFEQLAEEQLVLSDPNNFNFLWQDMKKKVRNKLQRGKLDEATIEQMLEDMEKEKESKTKKRPLLPFKKGTGILSGLKSLVRVGRSLREERAFWETDEFDEQMQLAARIGRASDNEAQCTTTFSACPYSIKQMRDMVTGDEGEEEEKEEEIGNGTKEPVWYENNKGPNPVKVKNKVKVEDVPQRPKPTAAPNGISHAIYAMNPGSKEGRRPSPKPKTPPPAAKGKRPSPKPNGGKPTPKPKPTTERTLVESKEDGKFPKKPYVGGIKSKEPEDDEESYDAVLTPYEKKNVVRVKPTPQLKDKVKNKGRVPLGTSSVKIIKSKDADADDEEASPESEESVEEEASKVKPQKNEKETSTEDSDQETSSEEKKEPAVSKNVATRPQQKPGPTTPQPKIDQKKVKEKRQKGKIGLNLPKYQIKRKRRPPPLSREEGTDKIQSKKEAEIAASSEEKPSEEEKAEDTNQKSSEEIPSSEEKPAEEQLADKLKLNQKPKKYKLKNNSNTKLEFKKFEVSEELSPYSVEDKDQEQKKAAIKHSSEDTEKTSSEEEEEIPDVVSEEEEQELDSEEQATVALAGEKPEPPMHPTPTTKKPKHAGLLNALFGTKKKQEARKPPPPPSKSTERPARPEPTPPPQNKDSSEQKEARQEEEEEEGAGGDSAAEPDSSEESATKPEPTLPPNLPPVYGTTAAPTTPTETDVFIKPKTKEKKQEEKNKPVVVQPLDYKDKASKFPPLPRFPPPARKPTETTTTTESTNPEGDSDTKGKGSKKKDSDEYDSSGSKEDDNKTAESKESSEEDPNHVKNIFSKASIHALGKDQEEKEGRPTRIPPPPPPIANYKPPNANETQVPLLNVSSISSKAHATLVTPTHLPEDKPEPNSLEEREDDSMEIGSSKEIQEDAKEDSDESSEEERPKGNRKKVVDDEAENREPVILPKDKDVPEIGDEVVIITADPVKDQFGAPAPAIALVSDWEKDKNEIRVPLNPPDTETKAVGSAAGPKPPKRKNAGAQAGGAGTRVGPEDAKVVPAAGTNFAPGSPGGGLPSPPGTGGLNSLGQLAQQGQGNRGQGQGQGQGQGGNGGGTRNPGGGNRGTGNRRPTGTGNNANGGEDEDEDSSEEELGKPSEEKEDKTSEEEEDDYDDGRGRTGLSKYKEGEVSDSKKDDLLTQKSAYEKPHVYPPLPPIYKWRNDQKPPQPTLMTRLLKPKIIKPKLKLPKANPTKDTFYTKPLSPKLVQYLRDTYGPSYTIPERRRNQIRASNTTPKPVIPSPPKSKGKKPSVTAASFSESFQQANIRNPEVIHFDDEDLASHGLFNKRIGLLDLNSSASIKNRRRRPTLPPVFGKIKVIG